MLHGYSNPLIASFKRLHKEPLFFFLEKNLRIEKTKLTCSKIYKSLLIAVGLKYFISFQSNTILGQREGGALSLRK